MTILTGQEGFRVERVRPPGLLTSLVLSSAIGSVDVFNRPWRLESGHRGLTATTTRPDTVKLPGRPGVVLRRLGRTSNPADERYIELPLFLGNRPEVGTPALLSAEVDRLQDVIDPAVYRDGELTLTGTRADGTTRSIPVLWTPVDGDMDPLAFWQTSWKPLVRLLAPDPDFRRAARPVTWGASSGVGPMLPFFPLRIGSSTVIGTANPIIIRGNRDAYPLVTVTGPGTSVTLEREDGTSWTLTPPSPLLEGQTVVVRHDPNTGVVNDEDVVTGPAGQAWYRYLSGVLFGLRPGTERVTVTIPGASSTTSATLAYDYRYRSLV